MRDERMPFDFHRFKNKFLGKEIEEGNKPKNLLGFIHWYSEQLREKNKLGTLTTFTTLHSVLITHGCSEKVMLEDVDIDFLEKFEKDLLKRKNKHTGEPIKKGSVFSYFKNLKTIFNKAIYYKLTTHYPFKNRANPWGYSFSHLTSPRISKSMSNEDVKKFFDFDWKNGSRKQKLAWKISYFIYQYRGIPIGDAARLTIKDIANDQVMFGRIKTSNKVPNIPINERRKWILDLLKKDTDGIHLLPILHKGRHDTPQSILNRINKMKTLVNTGMKEIAELQGINMNLSTYTLRHTFSRKVLEEYGIWHLKEIHGHKSVNTTQHYANSLSSKELEVTDSVFE
jgi:integrase